MVSPELFKKMKERYFEESYLSVLQDLHFILKPTFYLEIGIAYGDSLSLALPETFAIGVDPKPNIIHPLQAWTKVYRMTSEDFFSDYSGAPFDFIFIDGYHSYEAVVQDFIHAEKLCKPTTVIAIHDTIPLSAGTSGEYIEGYWTGDVWKIVPALIHERTDLTILTHRCQPSGLTLITGFGKGKGISEKTIEEYRKKTFEWVDSDWKNILKVLPDDQKIWMSLITAS